ncbi:MAG: cell division protein FtsL [Acidobacteriaceae bacterium]|nr:cell division protein FtsL [Acidobacteriaceae bacterium]
MASLATFVNRFVGVRELVEAPTAIWTRSESPRLRPIANEDVYLFVKRIDNTTVIRAADPAARRARTHSVATAFLAALLVIAGLLPTAYNIMAGFTLQNLRQEQEQLKQQEAQLDLEQAKLLSYDRLEQLANSLKMVDPAPQQVQYLESKSKAEARNDVPGGAERMAR